MGFGPLRWSVFGLATSVVFSGFLAGCGRGEAKSDIQLTSPATASAAVDENFGDAVGQASRADANSDPRDPVLEDMGPVSYTAEPVPLPAE